MDIAIVDYGASNLYSVFDAFDRLGEDCRIAQTPEEVLSADRLVLPGVGAAGLAMRALTERGLDEALTEAVRRRGRPFLGICLGMQLLAERLLEFGEHAGLGWCSGDVVPLRELVSDTAHIPHMGWNRVDVEPAAASFFEGIRGAPEFYFAHSFAMKPKDASIVAATSDYHGRFTAAVQFDSVFATQFHPEKSQLVGECLLDNFLTWQP